MLLAEQVRPGTNPTQSQTNPASLVVFRPTLLCACRLLLPRGGRSKQTHLTLYKPLQSLHRRDGRSATHNVAFAARWDGRGAPRRAAAPTAAPRMRVRAQREWRAPAAPPAGTAQHRPSTPSTALGLSRGTLRRARVLKGTHAELTRHSRDTHAALTRHSRGTHAALTRHCAEPRGGGRGSARRPRGTADWSAAHTEQTQSATGQAGAQRRRAADWRTNRWRAAATPRGPRQAGATSTLEYPILEYPAGPTAGRTAAQRSGGSHAALCGARGYDAEGSVPYGTAGRATSTLEYPILEYPMLECASSPCPHLHRD